MKTRITFNEFLNRCRVVHGNKYQYDEASFSSMNTKTRIKCPSHGWFYQTPKNHVRGQDCNLCGRRKISVSKSDTTQDFVEKSMAAHGDRYDYSRANYKSSHIKVEIICTIHGSFFQSPNHHLSRLQGCPKCKGELISEKRRLTPNQIVERCRSVHGNRYDYPMVDRGVDGKITIVCPIHGSFKQDLFNHLNGIGCPRCGGCLKPTLDEFIAKSRKVHGNKYDYSKFNYVNAKTKGTIICPIHGEFLQVPNNHLSGNGCEKCITSVSNSETKFLDLLSVPNQYRQYRLGKYKVDGFDPLTNTVYEFLGDFWHGNPKIYESSDRHRVSNKTYGEIYNATMKKFDDLKNMGYNVNYIWEDDWKRLVQNNPSNMTNVVDDFMATTKTRMNP
jgi:hypothetical protein